MKLRKWGATWPCAFAIVVLAPQLAAEQGLPLMNIYHADVHRAGPQTFEVAQDLRGVLYFGNLHGLLSFDGAWWRLIKLPDDQVPLTVESDATGRIHVGLVNDLGYVAANANGSLEFRSLLPQLPEGDRNFGDVRGSCVTEAGILFLTERNILLWNGRTARVILRHDPSVGARDCSVARGQILLRAPTGLQRLNPRTLQLEPTSVTRPVTAFIEDANGSLVIAVRNDRLYAVAGDGTLQPYSPDGSAWLTGNDRVVTGVARLRDGRLVFATRQHELLILTRDGAIDMILDDHAGLPDAVTNDVFVDREGTLWVVMEGPLVRVDLGSPVSVYDARRGIRGSTGDVTRYKGRVYVASTHGLFVIGPNGHAERLAGIPEGPWRLLGAGDELLIGSTKGVYRLRDRAPELVIPMTTSIYDLSRSPGNPDRVWIATDEGPVSIRRRNGTWTLEHTVEGITESSTVIERFGVLWSGTVFHGLIRVENPLSRQPRLTQYGSGEVNVHEIEGRLVAVAASDGALLQPADEPGPAGMSHKLVPDPVLGHIRVPDTFAIAQDARGNLWLNSLPPRVIERGADGRFRNEPRPLAGVTATDIQNVRAETNGVVWFSTDRGLFRYEPRGTTAPTPQARPLIRQIATGEGKSLHGGEGGDRPQRLAHDFGRIRIDFAPASFGPGILYQYRLDPVDARWSDWTATPSIDYTTLAPGKYTFRLRTRNPSGSVSPDTSWSFTVTPPWYRHPASLVAWLLLACTAIAAGIRLRTRALRTHALELKAQVDQQTAKLQEAVGLLERTNLELREAQEKIARFNESSGEALRDVQTWSRETAADLAGTIHAAKILVFIAVDGELVPLTATEVRPPRLDELEALPHKNTPLTTADGHTVMAVPGLTGRVFGALAIIGKATSWSDPERQLISTFAHQLGGALELQQVRNDLVVARERNLAVRKQMTERGVALLQVCPTCGRCYDDKAPRCIDDRAALDASRVLPYSVADRYRLMKLLGAGGMGEVFAARDERLDRDVAVKVIKAGHLDPAVRSRFDREARAVARVHHPNVVAIYDSGELDEGSAYIVTELLEGCDLGYVLRRHGRGTPAQVASLVMQGTAALAAAHAAGLIHRDIKPANLFLVNAEATFEVKLVDFGIAKTTDLEAQLTHSGTLIGTPAYMAPEQITRGHADTRSDLYSFAAVVYEALTGVRVTGHASGFAALWDVMSMEALPASKLRPALTTPVDRALKTALAKNPHERPADLAAWATELAEELSKISTTEPGWPHPIVREQRLPYATVAAPLDPAIAPTTPNVPGP